MAEEKSCNFPKRLIKTQELAAILGVGVSTIEQARLTGRLPIPFVRLGRSIRYNITDVENYIANLKAYKSTSEADRL